MDEFIESLIKQFKTGMTLDGCQRVFNDGQELTSSHFIKDQKPEEYTKRNLIMLILEHFDCTVDEFERIFNVPKKGKREIDYTFHTSFGEKYILEAKPINADLFSKDINGAVNEIKDAFILKEVAAEFKFGIATDGIRWLFFNSDSELIGDFDITKNYDSIKSVLVGNIVPELNKQEISKKFYKWYSALLFGGSYSDHNGENKKISLEDSLVNSIINVERKEDKEKIAQTTIDRLVFIKFLESRGIIKNKIIHYMSTLEDSDLRSSLRSLFFDVMNTKEEERDGVNPVFEKIPYLNGSLFSRIQVEIDNDEYKIKSSILRKIFEFLDSFTFSSEGSDVIGSLDPEILGYIFEMSMLDVDRKGTGAVYTPKEITTFMSRDAIHKKFVENVKDFMKTEGYDKIDIESIDSMEKVYSLNEIKQGKIFQLVLPKFRVCDNACGSGAFLLASADVLFEIYKNISHNVGLKNNDSVLKKLILINNIYGVDLNPNAVEIAKLRLWLWLADSYKQNVKPDALPNIDYNLRSGNSLIGYINVDEYINGRITLDDYLSGGSAKKLLLERRKLISDYKNMSGFEARNLKKKIDGTTNMIRDKLSLSLYNSIAPLINCTSEEFLKLHPFHWGFEFDEVFDDGGFDVIVGNPPYIPLQNMTNSDIASVRVSRSYYEIVGFKTFAALGDIYCLFFERCNNLLKNSGILSYITSSKWMKTSYGKNTRKYFIENTFLRKIINIAGLQIFKDVTVEPSILSFMSIKNINKIEESDVETCKISDDSELSIISDYFEKNKIVQKLNKKLTWDIASNRELIIKGRLDSIGVPLKSFNNSINFGIKTAYNPAYVIDNIERDRLVAEDPKNIDIIVPLFVGKGIQKYVSNPSSYLINVHNGCKTIKLNPIVIDDYKTIKKFMDNHLDNLVKRKDQGITPYNLRSCAYLDDFNKPKLIWKRVGSIVRFSYDESGSYCLDSACIMVGQHLKYLCMFFNSKLGRFLLDFSPRTGTGDLLLSVQALNPIHIVVPSYEQEFYLENIYNKIVENLNCGNTIDKLVTDADDYIFDMYNLSDEDRKYICDLHLQW